MALALLLQAAAAAVAAQGLGTEPSWDLGPDRESPPPFRSDTQGFDDWRSFRYEQNLTDQFEKQRGGSAASEQESAAERPFRVERVLHRRANWKAFIPLSAAVYTMGLLDQTATVGHRYWRINEQDPIVKPFTQVPAPLFVAGGVAFETGVNWLAWRLGRSRRWHKVWWLPQVCAVGANAYGYDISTHY